MNNFSFANPVKIIFGKDTIKNISNEIPQNSPVLIIYGGGSIKKNGVYDQVISALNGYKVFEFDGIEPNPHYETCMKAVAFIKEQKIGYLLAVGGGSVIDATKFIAAAACIEDSDPWNILLKHLPVNTAMPFGTILTLPATGSEMNSGAVITRTETKDKLAFDSTAVYPKFSVLDPETTFTLPVRQIGNGVVDTFVHVAEQYLTYPTGALLQNMFAESVLRTLIIEGPKALKNPDDYDVRANLMWASTWGLNGWLKCGIVQDWSTHMIGHEITALYGLDHAQTLAIVLPGVLTLLKAQKEEMILRMGEEVFGIYNNMPKEERINLSIQAVEDFFNQMGVKTRLSDYGLGKETVEAVSERIKARGWKLGEKANIGYEEVKEILTLRL
ncbi:iron-containing alcohol dehydrogenase [Dysgonomonas sp. 216]|uniref:iron-containing alcohol dehydrogenase n=1 Tax=Dysgonomonas sp. 216 TaxID=2302934 RepID=UPI0013D60863|nr:iron-containing alcohol dehydrogenase [Dysgonomonas sp. 216]NDW17990.1 iron-containing alcohol dehydrogenase [Dysgonomonas sp. 216]